ncbi:MAG: alpha/beta fold hydrolase [Proteobacteria bacterium]|nr:alpha/beta fold hydrolase [Pseudomonadota bacterium]
MATHNSTPIHFDKKHRQTLMVSAIISSMSLVGILFSLSIWSYFCNHKLMACFVEPEPVSFVFYLLMATIRPFTLLPQSLFWLMSAATFFTGPSVSPISFICGVILLLISSPLSFIPVYFLGLGLYHRVTQPWFLTHLPKNIKKTQQNAFSLVYQTRLLCFVYHDLMTLIYGVFGLPFKTSLRASFLCEALRIVLFSLLCLKFHPVIALAFTFMSTLVIQMTIMIVKQMTSLLKGYSYLNTCKRLWHEAFSEIKVNNMTTHSYPEFHGDRPPILLLYGFFASRRTVVVMEKLLKMKGYEVFTLNLGGLFDVFFTKSIPKSAKQLDYMLSDIMQKTGIKEISIVAHSKGGLVAAWWLLRYQGHRYCRRLITLGSPFGGTFFTWIALITPLGLFWQDVWQMRPNSRLLKALRDSYIPKSLKIYCMYSCRDRITYHKKGVFQGAYGHIKNIVAVPMHRIAHFQYIYKKSVIEKIDRILSDGD